MIRLAAAGNSGSLRRRLCRALVATQRPCSETLTPYTSIGDQFRFPVNSRMYSCTRPSLDDGKDGNGGDVKLQTDEQGKAQDMELILKAARRDYGNRRAAYKRQVKQLRKQYHDTYLKQTQQDQLEHLKQTQETTRRRLERKRKKNERAAQNALRQEEFRRQAQVAFEQHIREQQVVRDEEKAKQRMIRKWVYNELEKEAPLWITSQEEIDKAFTHEAEQMLWTFPGGYIGVPNPSLDSHFWSYECHTWHMNKVYKSQRDILLEKVEDELYTQANVDPNFWTEERLQERQETLDKAKLRALVRLEGRRKLLQKQRNYLEEEKQAQEIPQPPPVPSLAVLKNLKAQEKEGAEILFNDPSKFFVFDGSSDTSDKGKDEDVQSSSSYTGPSLGAPVAVRDPLRTGSTTDSVFPQAIGKLPKPDQRTEKEKKRQEREQKLWKAARAEAADLEADIDVAAAGDADMGFDGEALDYDKADDEWDEDDEQWVKGLDPDRDEAIINKPRELRYKKDDFEWVVGELSTKLEQLQSSLQNDLSTVQRELISKAEGTDTDALLAAIGANADDEEDQDIPSDPEVDPTEAERFLDDATVQKLQALGADTDHYESVLASLTDVQLVAVCSVDFENAVKVTEQKLAWSLAPTGKDFEAGLEDEDMIRPLQQIEGLSPEQITSIVELQKLLLRCDDDSDETFEPGHELSSTTQQPNTPKDES